MAKQQVFKAYPEVAPATKPVRRPHVGTCAECGRETVLEMQLLAYVYEAEHRRIVAHGIGLLCLPCAREAFGV